MHRIVDQYAIMPERTALTAQEGDKAIRDRTLSLKEANKQLAALDGLGLKIVIEGPKPILPAPPFRCSDWFNAGNPICRLGLSISREELMDRRRPIDEALMEFQILRPDVHIWDPFETLCPGTTCFAFDGSNRPLFFDGDHLSAHGNRLLYPSFEAMLFRMWGVSP